MNRSPGCTRRGRQLTDAEWEKDAYFHRVDTHSTEAMLSWLRSVSYSLENYGIRRNKDVRRDLAQTAEGIRARVRELDTRPDGAVFVTGVAAGIQREEDVRAARLAARQRRSSQPPFQSLPVIRGQLEIRGRLHDGHGTKTSR